MGAQRPVGDRTLLTHMGRKQTFAVMFETRTREQEF